MRSDRTCKDTAKHYATVLVLLLFCSIVFYVQTHYQHTSSSRPEDDYQGRIPQFHSSVDRDDDGVDDQLDILNGALAYVSTHPKYKSRYYKTGYPDDGYGVCTDVVAYALKNAGYDLQVLVDADIREQPQDYMVAEPDANIDFRRVRNLKVFFSHTAFALTTDVSEIEEWQGGDVVSSIWQSLDVMLDFQAVLPVVRKLSLDRFTTWEKRKLQELSLTLKVFARTALSPALLAPVNPIQRIVFWMK